MDVSDAEQFSLPAYMSALEHHVLHNRSRIKETWMDMPVWGDGISLRHFSEPQAVFHPLSGGILIPKNGLSDQLHSFYAVPRHGVVLGNHIDNRAAAYFAPVDPAMSTRDRLSAIQQNINDTLSVLSTVDFTEQSDADFLGTLGLLDTIKTSYLSLYHTLTYSERTDTQFHDDEYATVKQSLLGRAFDAVQTYYLYMLGHTQRALHISAKLPNMQRVLARDIEYMKQRNLPREHFRLPELDHPLSIAGNVILNIATYPSIDTIIGLPSGGTELAFAHQIGYELIHGRMPDIILVPLSTHSGLPNTDEKRDIQIVKQCLDSYHNAIDGKSILVTEDNANSGETASIIQSQLLSAGAKEAHVTIAALDTIRTAIKQTKWPADRRPRIVPGMSLVQNAVTIAPIIKRTFNDVSDDRQIVKLLRLRRIRDAYRAHLPNNEPLPDVQPGISTALNVKICGIHNAVDLRNAVSAGARMVGIHLTYDNPRGYESKVGSFAHPMAEIGLTMARGFHPQKSLPLPWAEYGSLKHMMADATDIQVPLTFVLLMRPKSVHDVLAMVETAVPKGFTHQIDLQIQRSYDQDFLKELRETLNAHGYTNIRIIQTFGANQEHIESLLQRANADDHIDFILLDSDLKGGTGIQTSSTLLVNLAEQIQKPWYLSGGLRAENIKNTLTSLRGTNLFGVDVESSVELERPISTTVGATHAFARVRKDIEKMNTFMYQVQQAELQTFFETRYMDLDVRQTEFYAVLKNGWKSAYEECGYYNLDAIARAVYAEATSRGIVGSINEEDFVAVFKEGAIAYPFVPDQYIQDNWPANNVQDFLNIIRTQVSATAGSVGVLTSGDSELFDSGSYQGSPEQVYRFRLSGLQRLMNDLYGPEGYTFIAHPFKVQEFESHILEKAKSSSSLVICIDDRVENLQKTRHLCEREGVRFVGINISSESNDADFIQCADLASAAEVITQLPTDAPHMYVLDMDDVLLKEQFRKDHQAKNIYLNLVKHTCIHI